MAPWLESLLIGGGFGLLLCLFVIPRSLREERIFGGVVAQLFHALGTWCLASVVPTTLVALLVFHVGFGVAFPMAFGLFALGYALFLVYALVEKPAAAAHASEEDVWTAERAKTSGL